MFSEGMATDRRSLLLACGATLLAAGADLIGVNNRDLRTFKTDLGTTLRMSELVADKQVLISESGIHTNEDIRKLEQAGVRAVLVGESLMRSEDIGGKIRELFGS